MNCVAPLIATEPVIVRSSVIVYKSSISKYTHYILPYFLFVYTKRVYIMFIYISPDRHVSLTLSSPLSLSSAFPPPLC